MAVVKELRDATHIELKSFIFDMAYKLLRCQQNKVQLGKLTPLYMIAKDNIGFRSLLILDKYRRIVYDLQLQLNRKIGLLLFRSCENDAQDLIRYAQGIITRFVYPYLTKEQILESWLDCTTVIEPAKTYSSDVKKLFYEFWDTENPNVLGILADALMDMGRDQEGEHLVTGVHGPACPVITNIRKALL
jgi:hypothetical protein